jgi:hypothetical protein
MTDFLVFGTKIILSFNLLLQFQIYFILQGYSLAHNYKTALDGAKNQSGSCENLRMSY